MLSPLFLERNKMSFFNLTHNSDVTSLEDKYKLYPTMFVIDMSSALDEFIEAVSRTEDIEVDVGDSLEEVIMHVSDQGMLDCGLTILEDSVMEHCKRNAAEDDGKIVVSAMLTLGKLVIQQLELYKVYDDKGGLPYQFSHYTDDGELVLKKSLLYV